MNSRKEVGPGDCLTDALMADYLEGALTPVVKAACEVHLIACDQCREKLAAFMRILLPDVTPQENEAIEEVLAKWEHRDPHPVVPRRGASRWKRVMAYGAIAAILALAFLVGSKVFRPTVNELLLTTYRPFEQRLSNQRYVEVTVTRGPEDFPDFDSLRKEMERRSRDPYQLGQFALIEKNYDEAIQQLSTAESENKTAEILNDLGVAYFNNGDLKLAREKLEAAIALDKTFRPALFNLALLDDFEGRTADANQKLARYRELDPESEWLKDLNKFVSQTKP